jgi:hypothetical protein
MNYPAPDLSWIKAFAALDVQNAIVVLGNERRVSAAQAAFSRAPWFHGRPFFPSVTMPQ